MNDRSRRWVARLGLSALMLACSDDGDGPGVANGEAGVEPPVPASSPAGEAEAPAAPGGVPSEQDEAQSDELPLSPASEDGPATGQAAPGPVQEPLPALPTVRQEHAVVALEGEIYVIGGFVPTITASVQAFDPAASAWRDAADFPFPLHHANAAVVGGRLFVAGFYLGMSFTNADGRVFEYDPVLDSWAERGLMPAGSERASSCVAAFDGKIYLFGGARAGSVQDASVYDVESNSWQELPPLPEPREHCVAAAIDGLLYVASGRSDGIAGLEPNTWAFDPATSSYTPRAPILTPRGGTAGAALEGRLFIFGGEGNPGDPSGVFPNVEAYDPATDSWEALPPMLVPRHGLGAAALGGRIYLPGGADAQGFGAADAHTVLSFAAP